MEYYRLKIGDVIEKLGSTKLGLSDSYVSFRQKKYGKNVVELEKKISFMDLLLLQFKSYLVWLLVFISLFAFFTGSVFHNSEQIIDGFIIAVIVIINVFIGAYQDYKSEKSAEVLKSMMKNSALVMRNGVKVKIDSKDLVPGDIIYLSEGDKIPADCRIIECKEFKVNESLLTGESHDITKNSGMISKPTPLSERTNMIYMNTFVTSGTAKAIVVRTGKNSEIGKIVGLLEEKETYPFVEEVDAASKNITYIALVMIFLVLLMFFLKNRDWISMFMIGSALIIGAIPEGLPAIVTFALGMGSLKLVKKNVLIKRKSLLETLGSVDVICTDKTGTLTENKMEVKKLFFDMHSFDSLKSISEDTFFHFRNCALLCNEAKNTDKGFVGVSEDIALIDLFNNIKCDIVDLRNKYVTKSLEPFSSDKKYALSVNIIGKNEISYRKGAPDVLLKLCSHYLENGKLVRLTDKSRNTILDALKKFSSEALRNIGFSYKLNSREVFIGAVGIYDRPKKGIKNTVELIYGAGIEIKMITGDDLHTAIAIAKECGFKNVNGVTWDDVKNMSLAELKEKVHNWNVFARMSPEFKLRILSALQETGSRVAITGDGVNDVPALKKAEVGIAMGKKGADIAKETADIILLDDDLSSIVESIREGRTIFSNVRKVINYLLTANLAEVMVVFIGSMFGFMPFLAIQLLWVNFVTDILPAMALGVDPPHKGIMHKKPTGKHEKLINKRITYLTIFIGLKKVIIMFALFFGVIKFTGNLELAQTISFTWLVFSHFVRIAAIRFDEKMSMFTNKFLMWSIVVPILFQIVIIYSPLSMFFHTVPLHPFFWSVLIFSVAFAVLLAKIITFLIDKYIPLEQSDY